MDTTFGKSTCTSQTQVLGGLGIPSRWQHLHIPNATPFPSRDGFPPKATWAPPTPQKRPGGDKCFSIFIGITGTFPEGRAFSGTSTGAFPGQSGSAGWLLPAGAPGSAQEFHQQHLEGTKPSQHSFIGFPACSQPLGIFGKAPTGQLRGLVQKIPL